MGIATRMAAIAAGALLLTGCVDADITVDIRSPEEITTTAVFSADRAFFDRVGGNADRFCEDGKGTIAEDKVTCIHVRTASIAELENDSARPSLFDLGNGRVKFEANFEDLVRSQAKAAGADEDVFDLSSTPLFQAIRLQMQGHTVTFTIRGRSIEETNMQLAENGHAATFKIPLASIFDKGGPDIPKKLYAIVDTRSCWLFGLVCF